MLENSMRFALLLVLANGLIGQTVPNAIFTDPPVDKAHPAKMTVLHIPSHALLINGVVYQPSGVGPHPTLVIMHGLPGNEKNLDLAQAVRRAGWNAVTFNYRGSWGSPGQFPVCAKPGRCRCGVGVFARAREGVGIGYRYQANRDRRTQHGRLGGGAYGFA